MCSSDLLLLGVVGDETSLDRLLKEYGKKITGIIYEPWHFRYVGKEAAAIMKRENLCLEEYVKLN